MGIGWQQGTFPCSQLLTRPCSVRPDDTGPHGTAKCSQARELGMKQDGQCDALPSSVGDAPLRKALSL